MKQIKYFPDHKKRHSKIPVKTQNLTCTANQQSITKLDPVMEQEILSRTLAPLYLGRSRCFWEISQPDYRYKKSFLWLFKPLMSAPSNFKRMHV